ncbi:MFS transporter [Kitasatospora sp. NBC_01302]|uniref:MFS transporter n=1 Tax=Kitasatospora sp. NBC_01302 TaxID=2903575 RepID=UPI002E0D39C7|nr:MFS transporter [Kitasatospora sp. NBC_01302]
MSQTLTGPRLSPGPSPASIGARLDRMPIGPVHRRLTAAIGAGLLFDTFENNLSGTIGKVLQHKFAMDATTLKFVLASAFIGQFLGSLVVGRLADRFGRRRAFLFNLALYSGFSLLGAFSPNATWLIATRFVAGIGIGSEQALADCYLADVLPASRRGRFIAWAYTLAYCGVPAVGFAALWLVPLSPLGLAGWRWLFVISSLGSAVVWVLRRNLIESPRWLAARGRVAEAEALVAVMEAGQAGGRPTAAVAEAPAAVAPAQRVRGAFDPGLRRRTVMLWILCTLSVVGYYGFGTLVPEILAAKGYGIVAGLGFTALCFLGYPVGSVLAVPIVERMERRTLLVLAATAMAVAGLGFGVAGSPVLIVLLGFGYTLCSNVFSSVSHVYLSEQYPTEIRGGASGAAYSLSKLAAGSLPFVLLPVLQHDGADALFAVIAATTVVMVVAVLSLGGRTTGVSVDRVLSE